MNFPAAVIARWLPQLDERLGIFILAIAGLAVLFMKEIVVPIPLIALGFVGLVVWSRRAAEIPLYLLTAFLPFSRLVSEPNETPSVLVTGALVAWTFLLHVARQRRTKQPIVRRTSTAWVIGLLLLLSVGSWLRAGARYGAWYLPAQFTELLGWCLPISFYGLALWVVPDARTLKTLVAIMLVAVAVVAAMATWDYMSESAGTFDTSRISGIADDPNRLGAFFVSYAFLFLGLWLELVSKPRVSRVADARRSAARSDDAGVAEGALRQGGTTPQMAACRRNPHAQMIGLGRSAAPRGVARRSRTFTSVRHAPRALRGLHLGPARPREVLKPTPMLPARALGWLMLIPLLLCARGVMVTFSRGAYLACVAGGLATLWFRHRLLFIAAAAAGLLALAHPVLLPGGIRYRLQMTLKPASHVTTARAVDATTWLEASAAGRLEIWQASVRIIRDHPWGIGFGAFPGFLPDYTNGRMEFRDAHNAFLMIASEMGLVTVVVFVAILVMIAFHAAWLVWYARDRLLNALGLGMLGGLAGVVVANQFSYCFGSQEVTGYFWLLSGLTVRAVLLERDARQSSAPGLR